MDFRVGAYWLVHGGRRWGDGPARARPGPWYEPSMGAQGADTTGVFTQAGGTLTWQVALPELLGLSCHQTVDVIICGLHTCQLANLCGQMHSNVYAHLETSLFAKVHFNLGQATRRKLGVAWHNMCSTILSTWAASWTDPLA